MIVLKSPPGFDPTWPAIPVDVTRDPIPPFNLAALLDPKDCERCGGDGWYSALSKCPDCHFGKVPQRVALAIETPCETCRSTGHVPVDLSRGRFEHCDACGDGRRVGHGRRFGVEYVAQVDAVVPVLSNKTCPGNGSPHVCASPDGGNAYKYPGRIAPLCGDRLALWPIDWSPGRVAVLISDVQRIAPHFVRPFDGPVAHLTEVTS